MSPLYVHVALTLALIESLGLGVLLLRVKAVPGLKLLVAFLFGVGVWTLSCELPVWFGAAMARTGAALVAVSSLTSAVFAHFVLVLCGIARRRPAVVLAYALGGGIAVIGLLVAPGRYQPWHGFDLFFFPNLLGWAIGLVWLALAASGHAVMAWCWWRRRGPPRGQLVAMCMASGWGALCMSGYAFPVLGVDVYPFPLLLLPLYPLILVYGILRYQLMVVNAWARRALAWALVVGLGSAAVIGIAVLPLPFTPVVSGWRLWATAVVSLLAAGLLLDPFRRLATRMVYPGAAVADDTLARWRAAFGAATSYETLALIGAREISAHLRVEVRVAVQPDAPPQAAAAVPMLACTRSDGRWRTALVGWDSAPPAPRYVAQLFGTVLAESAAGLEQAMAFAGRERERQQQAHLAELGALAATVAHDIRNPLNIIAMAAALAPAEVRCEIAAQTARISQLAADLLDYAKSWQVDKQPIDLADHVRVAAAAYAQLSIGPGLAAGVVVQADPRRFNQALINLLENAQAAIAEKATAGSILVDAGRDGDGAVELMVCDNGAGVPAEIRDTLFQPFVSRRPQGTGLGLPIVAKIMHAHGGSARLVERPDWSTCFVLAFPGGAAA